MTGKYKKMDKYLKISFIILHVLPWITILILYLYRIIKVWSKDTLILQASLHGHTDVIIDIAISKCNRYMASGSKDGVLIFWDL